MTDPYRNPWGDAATLRLCEEPLVLPATGGVYVLGWQAWLSWTCALRADRVAGLRRRRADGP